MAEAAPALEETTADRVFSVTLEQFEGPFDLLLQLIARSQLDVTSLALSQVTDDFLAHTRALGGTWDLGQTTEFLLVAATLVELKAARLLPSGAVDAGRSATPWTSSMLSDDQRCCHAPPGPGLASRTRWSMPRWRRK